MNLTDPLLRLFLKLLCVRSKICVFIPENLIRDLTCQYYTDVRLLMDCLTDQIHSDGSSDRRDIVSSKRLDNRFKCPDNIFFRDDDLVVVGVDIVCHFAGVFQIDGIYVHPDSPGLKRLIQKTGRDAADKR